MCGLRSPQFICIVAYKYQSAMQGEILRKGAWLQEEDEQLTNFVTLLGGRKWDSLAKLAGLRRSGKSCRLRWLNYLRPNLKHGPFSVEEERLIVRLQQQWGNKWSKIARRLPGRTDNEIKNYWRTHLRKSAQVQQEGEGKYKLENIAQDCNQKSIDSTVSISKDCNHNANVVYYQDSDELETKDSSSIDTFPLSSDYYWEMRNSPYETRILDWITGLQNGYGENELEQDCSWDYSGSLWEMN